MKLSLSTTLGLVLLSSSGAEAKFRQLKKSTKNSRKGSPCEALFEDFLVAKKQESTDDEDKVSFPDVCSLSGAYKSKYIRGYWTENRQLQDVKPLCPFAQINEFRGGSGGDAAILLYDACTCYWMLEEDCGKDLSNEICPIYGAFSDIVEDIEQLGRRQNREDVIEGMLEMMDSRTDKCGCACQNSAWAGDWVVAVNRE